MEDLLIGHLLGNLQAAFACLGEDLVTRQTGAVVAHFDDDVATLVIGLQGDRADRALARGNPRFRRFDTVIQAVADQVSQRVGDTLDQALVQFRRLAGGFQFNLFAQLAGQVAHHTGETGEHEGNRHHADGHDRFLQIAGIAFQLGQTIHQPLRGAFLHLRRCLQQHGLGNHQLANQVDQLVDFFDTDPDRRIAACSCG